MCILPILYKLGRGLIKSENFYKKKILTDNERKEHALNEFYDAMKEQDIGRMINPVKIYYNRYFRRDFNGEVNKTCRANKR